MDNQNTTFQLDICHDTETPWEALTKLWSDFDCWEDILNVKYLPLAGCWPVFEITTGTEETARAIIGVYLQVDPYDNEVTEYLSCAN
jgi:hypothetical protein